MAACGSGAIDNLSSREASSSLARGNLAYSVTKAGIDQLNRQLTSEWGGGIRINAVARATSSVPRDGKVAYRYVARRWQRGTPIPRRHPLGRLAEPDNIASAIVFRRSAYVFPRTRETRGIFLIGYGGAQPFPQGASGIGAPEPAPGL